MGHDDKVGGPCQVSNEELCADTLTHYERLATVASEWNNQVPQAIKAWYAARSNPSAEPRSIAVLRGVSNLLRRCLRHGLLRAETEAMLLDIEAALTVAPPSADRTQVEFRTADLPRKEPKIVCDGREVETPSSVEPHDLRLATGMLEGYMRQAAAHPGDVETLIPAIGETLRRLVEHASATSAQLPADNDGKEQDAFEKWAASEAYTMTTHPLHWLFLDKRTYAARDGWRAALRYVAQMARSEGAGP